MAFVIKNLTVRNFMSVGNATQSVNLDRSDLTLVLGENLDLGGDDSGARNGTGKSTLLNALSYALYGTALTNIRKDNLINKTNAKNMLVTLEFECDGKSYKIERGRKINLLKFTIDDVEQQAVDESQGDSRQTQAAIERVLGMSCDMFRHIAALNTYSEPFLSLRSIDQRAIIEQLLGITLLSEKALAIKELSKASRDAIEQEEFRINTVTGANARITTQINSLTRRSTEWAKKHAEDIRALEVASSKLIKVDIETEIAVHGEVALIENTTKELDAIIKSVTHTDSNIIRETKSIANLEKEIAALTSHICHVCGHELHDKKQKEILASKQTLLETHTNEYNALVVELNKLQDIATAIVDAGSIVDVPTTFYKCVTDAHNHKITLSHLQAQIVTKTAEENPYTDQIAEMKETANEVVNWDLVNLLVKTRDHQEFLYKLLTNKDSFVRKKIIDQNLSYLNSRLCHYLDAIGLPHAVTFQNDLTVRIEELGRELDFDNLSRGERTRLILSLSWAFRDVWESLYQPINIMIVDELLDSGMDASGAENALSILKKLSRDRNKSVWLISHKDELISRVNSILKVTKTNGFTEYSLNGE